MKRIIIIATILLTAFSARAAIALRLPTVNGTVGDTVTVALYADTELAGNDLVAYQFSIEYDAVRVQFIDVQTTVLTGAWGNPVVNVGDNRVNIAAAGTTPLSGEGAMLLLRFQLLATSYSNLTFRGATANNFFNEGTPACTFTNGRINIAAIPTISVNIPYNTTPMLIGSTINLSASGGTAPYTWEVTDPALATIAANGQLTATVAGLVKAKATDANGHSGLSANIEIRGYRLFINDTTFYQNQFIEIPVRFQNLGNTPVFSGEFSVEYNPAILTFDELIVENNLIGTNGNAFDYHVSAPSATVQKTRISFANTGGFTLSGNLATIRFRIANAASGNTNLNFTGVQFNDGELAILKNGNFHITALPALTVTPATNFQHYAGETRQLQVSGGTAPYVWTSNRPLVASVDDNGLVTVYKGGEASIKVTDVWGAQKSVTFTTFDTKIKVADTLGIVEHRKTRMAVEMLMPVAAARNFTALQGKIVCHAPQVAAIAIVTENSLTANFASAQLNSDSICSFALSGTQVLTEAGTLFFVEFTFNDSIRQGDTFDVSLTDLILNENSPNAVVENGRLEVEVHQNVVVDDDEIGNQDGGTVGIDLENATTLTFTGTITLSLPAGFTLDEANTAINPVLAGVIDLSISELGNNLWQFTFTMELPEGAPSPVSGRDAARHVSTISDYTNLLNFAYQIDESITTGDYQATIQAINLVFEDGSTLDEADVPIALHIELQTGINTIASEKLQIIMDNEQLIINHYAGGEVRIFDITGRNVGARFIAPTNNDAPATNDAPTINISQLPSGVYIVRVGNQSAKFVKR